MTDNKQSEKTKKAEKTTSPVEYFPAELPAPIVDWTDEDDSSE